MAGGAFTLSACTTRSLSVTSFNSNFISGTNQVASLTKAEFFASFSRANYNPNSSLFDQSSDAPCFFYSRFSTPVGLWYVDLEGNKEDGEAEENLSSPHCR